MKFTKEDEDLLAKLLSVSVNAPSEVAEGVVDVLVKIALTHVGAGAATATISAVIERHPEEAVGELERWLTRRPELPDSLWLLYARLLSERLNAETE